MNRFLVHVGSTYVFPGLIPPQDIQYTNVLDQHFVQPMLIIRGETLSTGAFQGRLADQGGLQNAVGILHL